MNHHIFIQNVSINIIISYRRQMRKWLSVEKYVVTFAPVSSIMYLTRLRSSPLKPVIDMINCRQGRSSL